MGIKIFFLLNLLGLLSQTSAQAQDIPDDGIAYYVKNMEDGNYQIDAYLSTKAPEIELWKAITEYEKTPTFVHSVKSSQVKSRDKNVVLVEMNCAGKVLFLPIKVNLMLNIIEKESEKTLDFVEKSGEDFKMFKGYWRVFNKNEKRVLHFSVLAKPIHSYFGFTRKVIDYSIQALFVDVQKKVSSI